LDPDRSVAQISALSESMIPEAAALLHRYAHPHDTGEGRLADCRAALVRLLASPVAHVWVASVAGRPAGFLAWTWSASTSTGLPVLRVEGLYTLPEYRRQGVASALLQRAAEEARGHGANRLQLETDVDNAEARRLYEVLGFEPLPRKRVYMRFL